MTSEVAKTIASSMIWVCTAIILAGGLYRMNGDAEFFGFATIVIMGGATLSTWLVWRRPRAQESVRGFDVVLPVEKIEKGMNE
jgi:hypothetical protein